MTDDRRHHLRLLGALDALLSERNVTRAALRLNLSQSATSGLLAQLRVLFNDPLLVRVGRELELTTRASDMLPMIRDALRGVDQLFGTHKPFSPEGLARQFRLAVSDAVGQLLIPELIRTLSKRAPGVTLKLSAIGAEVPEKLLADGAIDVAIGHFRETPEALRSVSLYEGRLVAVVRKNHPEIQGRITLEQLLNAHHVTIFPHPPVLQERLHELFSTSRRPFKLLASVQQLSIAMAIVEKIDAVTLITESMASLYANTYAIQVLELPRSAQLPDIRVRAVWHERAQHDQACAWLRDLLRESSSVFR